MPTEPAPLTPVDRELLRSRRWVAVLSILAVLLIYGAHYLHAAISACGRSVSPSYAESSIDYGAVAAPAGCSFRRAA